MRKIALIGTLILALALPYSVKADMQTGGTFIQFNPGLTTSIRPGFALYPTVGVLMWNEFKGIRFGLEGAVFTSDVQFDSTTESGWSGAAYLYVNTFSFGKEGSLHVLARGAAKTEADGSFHFSLDENQYEVGPTLVYDANGRSPEGSDFALMVSPYWMGSKGYVAHLGVNVQALVDFK